MKPVTTMPRPFSIQMAVMMPTQIANRYVKLFRIFGKSRRTRAVTARNCDVHMNGTRALWPCRPKKRYSKWCLCSGMSLYRAVKSSTRTKKMLTAMA